MKKTTIYITIIIILLGLVIADSIDTFYQKEETFNITFTGNENKTVYIEIPVYAYVENFNISIQGEQLT